MAEIKTFEYKSQELETRRDGDIYILSFHWRGRRLHHLRLSKVVSGDKSYDIYLESPGELKVFSDLILAAKDLCEELGYSSE